MQVWEQVLRYFLLGILMVALCPVRVMAQADSPAGKAGAPTASAEHDGGNDFDFELGSWKIHLKRLLHPLTGSTTWAEFDGTSITRKVWNGRSQVEEFEVGSPTGHIEGLTLRTYNPQTQQWSLYWANSNNGIIDPPQIGQFKDGRGEFYGQETLNGKPIFVRFVWSNTNSNLPHFEQSFSQDGGKTWEVNWITDQTRVPEESIKVYSPPPPPGSSVGSATAAGRDGQQDFDPLLGEWKYHLKRRLNPLTGSTNWVELYGTGTCFKVWDGRAQLDQIEVDGPTGHLEGLTLRLYNPQSRQWRLYWANSKDGIVVVPQIGQFKKGRGEFYAQDTLDGKSIFVRFDWSGMATNSPHFEQSFSEDGGKTWEANWITDQTRVSDTSRQQQ